MTPLSDERVLTLLRSELLPPPDAAPAADLWPRVRCRIDGGAHVRPSALDWILAAVVVLACLLRPSATAILLFHF